MNKSLMFWVFLSIVLCSCDAGTPTSTPTPMQTSGASIPPESLEVQTPEPSSSKALERLTAKEIHELQWLRGDWTEEQIEKLGLRSEANTSTGETRFYDDNIEYTYFDFWTSENTPAFIEVYGEYPGPRGFGVGDDFDKVLSLFPQDRDWRKDPHGVFYNNDNFNYDKLEIFVMSGRVQMNDQGDKELTLATENVYPGLRIYFHEDVVTRFTVTMFDAS